MSEASKAARKAMHEKIARLTADPHEKVDASDWTPPEPLNADVQTGERPVSPRQYKRGGKVEGEFAKIRADHKRRKSGGRTLTADSYLNRDVKEANEERDGTKHVGGFKRGGAPHGDEAEDRKLVKSMVRPDALKVGKKHGGEIHAHGCGCSKCSVSDGEMEGTRPTGGRMARKDGGRAGKGKMNVNIVIAAGGRSPGGDQQAPPAEMMPHPQGVPVPAPPPQGAAPMPVPVQMPPGAPPPGMMARKSGGRTMKVARDMAEHGGGGGSGLGRLEKIRAYGDQR